METGSIIFWVILGVVVFYLINIYNHLVRIKHNVAKAWSNIDVLLKQRHDEIPKLVETCKQYMKFEADTLEKVMQARNRVSAARQSQDMESLGAAEGMLRMGLGNLFAVAEAYPELKANDNFQHLQTRISSLESSIADRREFYNESVNINNTRIEQFPDIILARLLNFTARDLLEFSLEEIKDVNLKNLFE
ncbi:MAG: LemA family protein [Gammaproteobacteria bacterium]|nr:LemA family protein [Gammaproteobacteria bacterium]